MTARVLPALFFIILFLINPAQAGAAGDYPEIVKRSRALLEEFVRADTSNPPGNESKIVAIAAQRLKEAGIPFQITEFEKGRENIVARLKGSGRKKPLLILAHTDVVPASGQEWQTNPHSLAEKDGYLVARGVGDDLGYAAIALELLLEIKRSGATLERDIILALTGDEEKGGRGIQYLLAHHKDQIDAEIALNEGGGVQLGADLKPQLVQLQTTEKIYQDYSLLADGPTGHSSNPLPENAIYRLSRALARIADYKEPARLTPTTRAFLENRALVEKPPLSNAMAEAAKAKGDLPKEALAVLEANPALSAQLRTTCVATQLSAGTAPNALPAAAKANVNCRIMPDETPESVLNRLRKIVGDAKVRVEAASKFGHSGSSPVEGPVPAAVKGLAHDLLGGIPVVPYMNSGATDSRYLRELGIAAYGIGPVFSTEADRRRGHGIDERILIETLPRSTEFFHKLILALAAAGKTP